MIRVDPRLDVLGRFRRALRQRAHFGRDHREALAGVARARRLDARVQRQQIGLEGDAVDDADNFRNLVRRAFDAAHRLDRAGDDGARLFGLDARFLDDTIGADRTRGRLTDGRGDLVHRGGGFLQARGLLFGALRQIVGGLADVDRAAVDAIGGIGDRAHRFGDRVHRAVVVDAELFVFGWEGAVYAIAEIAAGKACQPFAERADDDLLRGSPGLDALGVCLENLHRARNAADAVAIVGVGDRRGQIARGQPLHPDDGGDIGIADQLAGDEHGRHGERGQHAGDGEIHMDLRRIGERREIGGGDPACGEQAKDHQQDLELQSDGGTFFEPIQHRRHSFSSRPSS
ncbi:hypothetical protein WR25_01893 [Diploscapter pachys]|uniref:Uncharacterized protein n=1 Tax=Diploscapter pachys TaxID=2018661 RepID=A0A2A2M346_9BILA|nr:hypothetical protein WR25_01893 [Diploscapter pachys]